MKATLLKQDMENQDSKERESRDAALQGILPAVRGHTLPLNPTNPLLFGCEPASAHTDQPVCPLSMGLQPALPSTFLKVGEDEPFRKASQPFLGKGKWEHQYFSLLMACDLEHVMCAFNGGLEKEEWEREREIPWSHFCLFFFLLLEHPWGLPFSGRNMVWRRKRVTHSQGGYLQVLFSRDQCVERGEELFQFCL